MGGILARCVNWDVYQHDVLAGMYISMMCVSWDVYQHDVLAGMYISMIC